MFTQKLYKTGNSVAVTIPKQLLKKFNLKIGSEVDLIPQGRKIIIAPSGIDLAKDVDIKFMKMVEEFVITHEDVLKTLAKG